MSDQIMTGNDKGGVLVTLGEDASTQLTVVGGKGASLGRLVKAGFPVPSGFVVTTRAYASFLRANDLEQKLENILEKLDYGNLDELEQKTAKIREAIGSCKLPDGLADTIVAAYRKLGDRGDLRWLKYHRGTFYYNTQVDERVAEIILPPNLRKYVISRVHPSRIDQVINAPFDFERIMAMHTRATTTTISGSWRRRSAIPRNCLACSRESKARHSSRNSSISRKDAPSSPSTRSSWR